MDEKLRTGVKYLVDICEGPRSLWAIGRRLTRINYLIGSMRTILIAAFSLACLAGCDTMHGVSVTLSAGQANQMTRQCVVTGLRSEGLKLAEKNQGEVAVSDEDSSDPWFAVDFTKAGQVRFSRVVLHDPLPCSSLMQVVSKMKAAAQSVQKECASSEITISDAWYVGQETCGL